MIGMVSISTCTPTFRNVCLGSESKLMELDHLSLAEYYASPDATYPADFGGRVSHSSQVMTSAELSEPLASEFTSPPEVPTGDVSSDYHNISQSCYEMLEK